MAKIFGRSCNRCGCGGFVDGGCGYSDWKLVGSDYSDCT